MVKMVAQVFGWVLLLVGILGFVPGVTTQAGLLLGIFQVDTVHNIIHLLTGAVGIFAAYGGYGSAKTYFQVFGVVYALVAIMGFFVPDGGKLLNLFAINTADNLLHVVIALLALYLGFGAKSEA